MAKARYFSDLRRTGVYAVIGLLAFTFLISPAYGLEEALQEKLNDAKGLALEVAGAMIQEADYPDGALLTLSKANEAVDLAYDLTQKAKMNRDGELSMQAVKVVDDVAGSTAVIVDQAPSPKDTAVLESALRIADTGAKALLAAAETARDTGNTELALAVVQAGGNIDTIINSILGIATETANMGLVTAAIAAEGPMSRTVMELGGYAKTAGNPALARQTMGIAERHSGLLQTTFVFADAMGDTPLAAEITAVLHNYSQAILAVAELAEATANSELGQAAVDQAYAAATALCRNKQLVQYAVSVSEDAGMVEAWESVLAQINTAEVITRNAIASGVASGAAAPGRPPCFAGPPTWWKEPPLNNTRYAEDEEEAGGGGDDGKPVSPI